MLRIHVDKKSGRRYSHNSLSGVSEWLEDLNEEEGKVTPTKKEKKKEKKKKEEDMSQWTTYKDAKSGRRYSSNKITKETKWEDGPKKNVKNQKK